jgi:predicted ATPase
MFWLTCTTLAIAIQRLDSACREHTYSKIFILPPWEEIYISDHERYENFEQAN